MLKLFRSCRTLLVSSPPPFPPSCRTCLRTDHFPQICQGFSKKTRLFLTDDEWITEPWADSVKTTLDKLIDILLTLPGVARQIEDMHLLQQQQQQQEDTEHPLPPPSPLFSLPHVLSQIDGRLVDLAKWRMEWDLLNPNCAREVSWTVTTDIIKSGQQPLPPDLALALSTRLQFSTLRQALETLYCCTGWLYALRLRQYVLSMPSAPPLPFSFPIPFRPDGSTLQNLLSSTGKNKNHNPILDLSWEEEEERDPTPPNITTTTTAAKADVVNTVLTILRTLPFLIDNLSIEREEFLIPFTPMGVLYCTVRDVAECRPLMPVLDTMPFFRKAEVELGFFDPLPREARHRMPPSPTMATSSEMMDTPFGME
jgi:hypothetical protein